MKKINTDGNVLLITLLLLGILSATAVLMAQLVLHELRLTRLSFQSTQARYAAESALENALYALKTNTFDALPAKQETLKNGAKWRFAIKEKYRKIPEEGFLPLALNETVTIPLFAGNRVQDNVKKFSVEYFIEPELSAGAFVPQGVDILRFKIFGITHDGKTESINEYFPPVLKTGDAKLACIGTPAHCWNAGVFYARSAAEGGAEKITVEHTSPIEKFLQNHAQNVLVLTNIINTDVLAGSAKTENAVIWYRVIEGDNEDRLLAPRIAISADGTYGNARESIDAVLDRQKLLPVFHFALYRTKTE